METSTAGAPATAYDIGGYRVFSHGEAGRAHVAAHRALDLGQLAGGHRELEGWLEDRPANTSELVHLHWHLLVFEIGVSRLDDAEHRLQRHLLPAVAFREAATDVPSALWRLRVAGSEPSRAAWGKSVAYARAGLARETSEFVLLHQLLALAGAGDYRALSDWNRTSDENRWSSAVRIYALGLEAWARDDHSLAADLLQRAAPDLVSRSGGSHAQNALFCLVAQHAARSVIEMPPPSVAA